MVLGEKSNIVNFSKKLVNVVRNPYGYPVNYLYNNIFVLKVKLQLNFYKYMIFLYLYFTTTIQLPYLC